MAEPETKKSAASGEAPKPESEKASSPFSGYLEKIKDRAKKTRVRTKHQMIGLEIADILGDRRHKALYMKIAKENGSDEALSLAKSVAENGAVKNKGAYFMKVWSESRKKNPSTEKTPSKTKQKSRRRGINKENGNSHDKKQKVGDLEALDAFL